MPFQRRPSTAEGPPITRRQAAYSRWIRRCLIVRTCLAEEQGIPDSQIAVIRTAVRQRVRLQGIEDRAVSRLVRSYTAASRVILNRADAFYDELEDLETLTRPLIERRFDRAPIARDVYQNAVGFTQVSSAAITEAQGAMVSRAALDASRLVGATLETAVRESFTVIDLRPSETDRLVGRLRNGVTIPQRLTPLASSMRAAVKDELATALINAVPRAEMRMALQARLAQAQAKGVQVGRTEVLRSYREAQRISYRQNSVERGGLVRGMRRFARRDSRTCMACIALDGAFYALGDPAPTHVNCRCGFIPEVVGGNPLMQGRVVASQWFEGLTPRRQRRILGPGKFDLYSNGRLPFDKWVAVDRSRVWGASEREPSIREILAGKSGPGIGVDIP